MPYCRRCGARVEENWLFCQKCGTQVMNIYTAPPAVPASSSKPLRRDPVILGGIALATILVSAAVISALLAAPIATWSYSTSFDDSTPNVHTLNLNFQANIGQVNIRTQQIAYDNVLVNVSGNGSKGVTSSSSAPINVTFIHQTLDEVLTVTMKVTVTQPLPIANIAYDIYVDPQLKLNLNVTSQTGQISFTADRPTTIESLNLKTTAGQVEANLNDNVTVVGDLSLETTTGSVVYSMGGTKVVGNCTLDLQSTTGEVTIDLTETKTLQGNLAIEAVTTTGSINENVIIDGGVGAKFTSQVNGFGNIRTNVTHFNGNKSPIQSNNYPATSNIDVNNHISGFGDVNINAIYQSQLISS